jgi:chromosome segregation and condensation protein ScpB
VLGYIQSKEFVTRAEILKRFERDDDATVRGVLRDFMESGLVLSTGAGNDTSYRVTTPEEALRLDGTRNRLVFEALVWSAVFSYQPVTAERLVEVCGIRRIDVDEALAALREHGRVESETADGACTYRSASTKGADPGSTAPRAGTPFMSSVGMASTAQPRPACAIAFCRMTSPAPARG